MVIPGYHLVELGNGRVGRQAEGKSGFLLTQLFEDPEGYSCIVFEVDTYNLYRVRLDETQEKLVIENVREPRDVRTMDFDLASQTRARRGEPMVLSEDGAATSPVIDIVLVYRDAHMKEDLPHCPLLEKFESRFPAASSAA